MAVLFNAPELVEMAVRIEEDGEKFYSKLAETKGEPLKGIFGYLAEQEKRHIEDFKELYKTVVDSPEVIMGDVEEFKLYMAAYTDSKFLKEFVKNANTVVEAKKEPEILDFAIQFEKETLLFYYGLHDVLSEAGKDLVKNIIEQEKEHIKNLSKIKREREA